MSRAGPGAPPAARAAGPGASGTDTRPAPLASEDLLRGRRLVELPHNGGVYRLQATRLGKVILTK